MRTFNYSEIKNQKWDSDILGLIAAIYKEAGKQELCQDTEYRGLQCHRRHCDHEYTNQAAC